MYFRLLFLFSCILHISFQRSTPQDDHYIAAVVEYEVSRDVVLNRQRYTQLIKDAADQQADIVIFPELTLTNRTTSIKVPIKGKLQEYPIPALRPDLYDDLLVAMSEAARDNQIYLVINTRERVDCVTNDSNEQCPEAKEYVFNTNVVFDRNGTVIDRYRKINLFGEPAHTPALTPDLGLFETDFGVTFGHFICFDLMFQVPAIQVVQKTGVTDVIFTTMWFSEMPYLTAVQIQESYAYAMNVNFLASGANNPAIGSAGSGIYSGKAGALISIMPGVPTTHLLIATVPKVPGQIGSVKVPGPIYDKPEDHDGLRLITDPSLTAHTSRLLAAGFQEFTLTDKDVSCTFRVRMNDRNGETAPYYRAIVQDGSNTYSRREIGVAACLLVACKNEDYKSCLYRFNPKETKSGIQELEINMRTYGYQYNDTLECDNVIYFPVSFTASKFPLAPVNFTYHELNNDKSNEKHKINEETDMTDLKSVFNDGKHSDVMNVRGNISFKLNTPQDELQAFGIWGRIYTRDVDHNKHKAVTEEDIQAFDNILDLIYETSDKNIAQ